MGKIGKAEAAILQVAYRQVYIGQFQSSWRPYEDK